MILLVSVSARMLAELATREGHDVVAVDRFGDLDLQRLCPSVSIMRDLGGRGGMAELVDAAERIPAESVVYGAGLENRPDLVARLAAGRTLLGCAPQTLRRVRDPALLGASLRAAGLAYPRTFSAREAPVRADRARRWLRKPIRGGGGRGVREWRGGRPAGDVIVQERIAGLPCSAAAVADGRSAALLGVSEQLIGRRALGARGYKWCGNVVPPRLPAGEQQRAGGRRPGDLRAPRRRLRPARRVRRGPRLGRRACRGWWRSTRARSRRSRRSTPRTACARSRRTWRGAPDACRPPARPVPRRSGPRRPARRCSSRPRTCGSRTRASGRPAGSATCRTPASRSQPAVRSARSSRPRARPEAVLADLEARAAALRRELHEVGVDAVA